jgi:hypothetical protein
MRLLGTKLAANSSHRGFGDQLYDLSGQRPSLDLNFANSKSLVDATTGQNLVTFTRASSGTYVGSDGVIWTATTDAPRFDHNPATGESLGLLVEEARTNLLLQSEACDTSPWTFTAPYSVTANAIASPDGAQTADALIVASGQSSFNSNVTRQVITKAASAIQYTRSAYFKTLGSTTSVRINDFSTSAANGATAVVSLVDGSIITAPSVAGAFSGASVVVSNAGNGWWRVAFTYTTDTATSLTIRSFPYVGAGVLTGDGSSGLYVWGAQLEAASFPTSYIPTTTATVTRSADVASITGASFSSWYNQTEGTVFAEFMPRTFSQACGLLSLDDGTTSERLQTRLNTSGNGTFVVADGGSVQANFGTTASAALNTKAKFATSFAANSFKASLNGGVVASDTAGTLPTVTQAVIGNAVGAFVFNGPLSRITFWPKELSESTLQQVTQ